MIELSGILTTYNRSALLDRVMTSIVAQTLPPDRYELIVIDDGSTDDTHSVLLRYRGKLPIRYFRQPNAGLAAARNHGLAMARAPLVLFMDDDDTIEPGTLAAHVETHTKFPQQEVAVLGHTRLDEEISGDVLMHYVTQVCGYLFLYKGIAEDQCLSYDYFWGGRISCKRLFVLQSGGFNPIFKFGCEDIELGYRLVSRGLKVLYNPNARSVMIRRIGFDGFCDRLQRQGSSQYIFSRLFLDDEVQKWCEMPMFYRDWDSLAPRAETILQRARKLDQWVRQSQTLGIPVDESVLSLLHSAYSEAFKVSKLAGVARTRDAWLDRTTEGASKPSHGSKGTLAITQVDRASLRSSLRAAAPGIGSRGAEDRSAVDRIMYNAQTSISRVLCSRTQLWKQLYYRLFYGVSFTRGRADKLVASVLQGYAFHGGPLSRSLKEMREIARKRLTSRTWLTKQLALRIFGRKSRALQNALQISARRDV